MSEPQDLDRASNPPNHTSSTKPSNPPGPRPEPGAARRIIEGNYFYVASAALMMADCLMLMRSPVAQGTEFFYKLKALLILQGYELLVILTAALLVRRFGRMGDAFTLLAVELLLLLDPTFFSNAFFTLLTLEGAAVNAGCFVAAVVKLAFLSKVLRLRLAPRTWAAFVFAAAFVYLAEGPMAPLAEGRRLLPQLDFTLPGYLYALGWSLMALAMLAPRVSDAVRPRAGDAAFMTPGQRAWLPRLAIGLPLAICVAHFIESSRVHEVRFYWLYGAPIVLAAGALIAGQARRGELGRLAWAIDLTVVIGLIASAGSLNIHFKDTLRGANPIVPGFIRDEIPAVAAVAGAFALYCFAYARHRHRGVVYRLAAILMAGAGYAAWSAGALTGAAGAADAGARSAGVWLAAHPVAYLAPLTLALAALAWRWRNVFTCFAAGLAAIWTASGLAPLDRLDVASELVQAVIALAIVTEHAFGRRDQRAGRYVLTAILASAALATWGNHLDADWRLGWIAAMAAGLIAGGALTRHAGYLVIGLLQVAIAVSVLWRDRGWPFDPAWATLAAGLAVFAAGVWVSLKKEALLDWATRSTGEGTPEAGTVPGGPSPKVQSDETSDAADAPPSDSGPPGDAPGESQELDEAIVLEPAGDSPKEEAEISVAEIEEGVTEFDWEEAVEDRPIPMAGAAPASDEGVEDEGGDAGDAGDAGIHLPAAPPLGREAATRLLEAIFITDPSAGIARVRDMSTAALRGLARQVRLAPEQRAVVCFLGIGGDGPARWRCLLTDRGLVHCDPEGGDETRIEYPQVARLSRKLGVIYVQGHAGQVFALGGLNPLQAHTLQRGVESLLAEMAVEGEKIERSADGIGEEE